MCGIFGYIGNISEELLVTCTDTLAHRGPDGRGIWHREGVALGHRRLSILDLSENGAQPMCYADGRYWITYNGEIYNFLELRKELEKRGYRFQSDSDTEVILAAFTEWREACLEKFNGMWAFAIWDSHEGSLFLSRDRFGKKPLFFAELPEGFAFASEMKALFPILPEVRPNLKLVKDVKSNFQYDNTEECVIGGIKRFPAGHYGWLRKANLTMHRWWCTLDHLLDVPARFEEQVEMFRELFIDACRLRMRSDVPLGTALSGGLDSSSTISAMAHISRTENGKRINHDWQHAFIACFPGTPLDESEYAKKVTDHLGVEGIFVNINPLERIERLYNDLYLYEELSLTSPIPFMMIYEKMRSHGVVVTIDGHGADELLGGYSFDYISALHEAGLNIGKVKMILDTYYDSMPQASEQFHLPPKVIFFVKWHILQLLGKLLGDKPYGSLDSTHPVYQSFDSMNKVLYDSTHTKVLPTILRSYDRYSMSNGVEIRMPFLDHRIVSFAFSIPWTSKLRNGFSKNIVREAMSPYMPQKIAFRRSKIGFNTPIIDWMRGPLKRFFIDMVHSPSFNECTLIESVKVRRMVMEVIESNNPLFNKGEMAWAHLIPFLWEQAVIQRKGQAPGR
jgi:asparagine synthase (glutamine-hydrolysing)